MQEARWHKIEEIFARAVNLSPTERKNFVEEICGEDADLCSEVLELLREDEENLDFLSEPIFTQALKIVHESDFANCVGQVFNSRYKILKFIGRGGMGAVFLAQDQQLDRPTALKIINPTDFGQTENTKRFEREAQAASKISHPNIAHIYEFGRDGEFYFIAMEFVDGKTLRELIEEKSIDKNRAVRLIRQIAEAISAAHHKGVIHRDIKPENIIITKNDLVKVLDFGLAKTKNIEERDENISLLDASILETTPVHLFGTLAYMSPEQAREQTLDERADLWSLGVIFYELLAGNRPFEGETRNEIIASILKSEPEKISKRNRRVSSRVEKVISKLLEKDRERRFQKVDDFLIALDNSKNKKPVKNPADSRFEKITGFVSGHKTLASIAALAILFVTPVAIYKYSTRGKEVTDAANRRITSIAVLPFVNESGDAERDYLSDGLTELFINRLSQLPDLTVKARNSVFRYKGKEFNSKVAGDELEVQAILLGRISEHNGAMIINLELVDVLTGNQIWGEQYHYKENALIGFQSEIVQDVSNKLRSRLSNKEEKNLKKIFTKNARAYEDFMRGRFHWNKRTANDLVKSVEYYEQAVELDPGFALAYAALADSYVLLSGYAVSTPQESFPKAKIAALKAIELDESLAEAHCALAYVLFNYDWNFEESEKEMRRALELNQNYSTAYHWYGNANLLAMKKYDESIKALERAQELDPLSLIINADLATSYLYAGQYEKAKKQYKKTLALDENFPYAHTYLGRTYLMTGDYKNALEEFDKSYALSKDPRILMLYSVTFSRMNRRNDAVKKIKELEKISQEKYVSPYYFALAYTALDDKDKAFEWLEKALAVREGRMTLIKTDPLLDSLQSDPRFQDFLKRVGLEKS